MINMITGNSINIQLRLSIAIKYWHDDWQKRLEKDKEAEPAVRPLYYL
jgi:hypothetical protein